MAATIESKFGLRPELIEGHNGIFLVEVNGTTLWENQSKCNSLPVEAQILSLLKNYANPLPGQEIKETLVFPLFQGK